MDTPAQQLADHSPMLSFSTSQQRAWEFCERQNKKRNTLKPCPMDQATHFLWELDFDLPRPYQPGCYHIVYQADPSNCQEIVAEQLRRNIDHELATGDINPLISTIMQACAMANVAVDQQDHYAYLIDVVSFLSAQDVSLREHSLIANTRERSLRDCEWLLYPFDPMPDGYEPSARFQMNKHLKVFKCFK